MNITNLASMLNTADLSLADKGIASAKVILTGFVVVFAMLVLLIVIIKVYSTIVEKATSGGKKKKKVKAEPVKEVVKTPAKVQAAAPAVQDGVPEEVVAVISAAVATMYGSSGKAKIKSIKKSNGGRSAWANAGVLENTRPF